MMIEKKTNNIAIKVDSLTKVYPLYRSSKDRMKEALHPRRKKYHKNFHALQDVSFEVERGDSLGIIGHNGSGKSTLLKILSKVLTPTSGTFEIKGRVVSLLELGSGFNPDLTGIENIYFYGTVLGFSKKKIEEYLDEILAYADIGQFIYQPLKTYSSGMRARLAFSVASHVNPDILILDEVLAVGDLRFKQKCLRTMHNIINNNRTVIFVSHDSEAVTSFCNNALWLNGGKIMEFGEAHDIVKKYVGFMTYGLETKKPINRKNKKEDEKIEQKEIENESKTLSTKDIEWTDVSKLDSFGEFGGFIENVALYYKDSDSRVETLKGGEWISLYAKIKVCKHIPSPGLGIKFKDNRGNGVFTINNYLYEKPLRPLNPGESLIIKTDFKMPLLRAGKYPLTIALSDGDQQNHVQHHWIHEALIVTIDNPLPMFRKGAEVLVLSLDNYNISVL